MTKLQGYLVSYCILLILTLIVLSPSLCLSVNAQDNSVSGTISLDRGQSFLDFGECNQVINYSFIVLEPGVIRNPPDGNQGIDDAWGNDITVTFYNVPGRYAPKDQYLNNIEDSMIKGKISTRHISFGLPSYEDSPFFIEPVIILYEINDLGKDCNMDGVVDNNTLDGNGDNGKNTSHVARGFLEKNYPVFILFWFIAGIMIGIVIYMDAIKRRKHGIQWALIGFLFSLLGLAIWLLVRPPKEQS